jgi:hypothetical protein
VTLIGRPVAADGFVCRNTHPTQTPPPSVELGGGAMPFAFVVTFNRTITSRSHAGLDASGGLQVHGVAAVSDLSDLSDLARDSPPRSWHAKRSAVPRLHSCDNMVA